MRSDAMQRFWRQKELPAGETKLHKWKIHVWRNQPKLPGRHPVAEIVVFHYETIMARLAEYNDGTYEALYLSIGQGSRSDQNGMNRMFQELRLKYYYSGAGGAHINKL